MSKIQMALLAIVAVSTTMGVSFTLADAAKPEIVQDDTSKFSFNNNWCGDNTTVDKVSHITMTYFGGENYKIEITETYDLFDESDVLIGKGLGQLKQQGKLSDGVEILKFKVDVNCLNGGEDPVNIKTGYTINKNGKVTHGN